MHDATTLQNKADRAERRSNRAKWISGTAGLYGLLSLPGGSEASSPKTPYDYTLGWAVDMVDTANQVGSFFLENVLSIKIPANVVGAVVGFGLSVVTGLYSKSQHKKMTKFQAAADDMSGKKEAFTSTSNELKL